MKRPDTPFCAGASGLGNRWWALPDSNQQPRDYESPALTVAPRARMQCHDGFDEKKDRSQMP